MSFTPVPVEEEASPSRLALAEAIRREIGDTDDRPLSRPQALVAAACIESELLALGYVLSKAPA